MDPREVGWRVTPPGERPKRRFGLFTPPHQVGRLLELSVSGGQIRAAAANDLGPGAKVWIELDGVVGPVRIRRIMREPGAKRGTGDCVYGFELPSESDCEITRHAHRLLDTEFGLQAHQWHNTNLT